MVDPLKLCQIEFCVAEPRKTAMFLEEVFGWSTAPAELQDYIVIDVPESCPYGISLVPQGPSEVKSQSVVLYFSVDDVEEIVAKTKKKGGQVRFGPKKLPGYGTIYQIATPDGLRFGIFKKN